MRSYSVWSNNVNIMKGIPTIVPMWIVLWKETVSDNITKWTIRKRISTTKLSHFYEAYPKCQLLLHPWRTEGQYHRWNSWQASLWTFIFHFSLNSKLQISTMTSLNYCCDSLFLCNSYSKFLYLLWQYLIV